MTYPHQRQKLSESYPDSDEQFLMIEILKRRYPLLNRAPKPKDSYNHWRIADWFHRMDAIYFHLEEGQHYRESMIEADYFGYKWVTKTHAYIKIDRKELEMTEIDKDGYDIARGSRMNERGIIEFYKDGEWR
jgi:hypothetical protein